MSEEPPPLRDDVRRLLAEHVDSLEKLELLLLVSGRPGESWTLADAAAAIRLPLPQLREAVDALRAAGVVRVVPGKHTRFELAPATPALGSACAALCAAYEADRVEVLKLTSRLALDRVRESAATTFADAFRIRRRREEGGGGSDDG